jgi:hypothetical protein
MRLDAVAAEVAGEFRGGNGLAGSLGGSRDCGANSRNDSSCAIVRVVPSTTFTSELPICVVCSGARFRAKVAA